MNLKKGVRPAGIMVLTMVLGLTAMAQEQPDRLLKVRPADERSRDMGASPAQTHDRVPVLPPADLPPEGGLAAVDRIFVRRVVLEGRTLLTDREAAEIVEPYQGRTVAIEELYALRRELSEAYVRRGYINSGVVIPDQEVADGVVVMREVRGRLTRIEITGNGRLSPRYITSRIKSAADGPLQLRDLQNALELLQQDPLIERINARLDPGLRMGDGELTVALKRTPSFQVVAGANNQGSASTGGEQGTLSVAHLNLLGRGDALSADLSMSGGRATGSLAYSFPFGARGTRIQAAFARDDARIIEEPFNLIDIRSQIMRGSLFVSHPWIRDTARSLVSFVGIERRHSESTLLGIPFSFSPGDRAGKSDTTVVSAAVEYTVRARNQALALRGSLRQGVDLFGPTIHEKGPDGRFSAFLGQAHYARRIGSFGSELLFRWTGQFAADQLLALEKIPIGGLYTVRGHRENLYVRDNGFAGSLEYRVPVRLGRSREGRFDPLNLRIAPFVDYGRSWDKDGALVTSAAQVISSAGVGLLWNPMPGFRADVYWGHPLKGPGNRGHSIQDKGIHLTLHYRIPF